MDISPISTYFEAKAFDPCPLHLYTEGSFHCNLKYMLHFENQPVHTIQNMFKCHQIHRTTVWKKFVNKVQYALEN